MANFNMISLDITDWFIGTDLLPNISFPIIYFSIQGVRQQDKQHSSFNLEEVMAVMSYVNRILKQPWNGKKIWPCDIGIHLFTFI